ncbi:DUF5908 family protein [Erwinia oleae]|uniref:DUF5908 family protein n=1 Tax=Erwinia oleae TaxID=796334 RepID=UPI000AE21ED2|nr:DUF5908 family protein [Erwinia oleae]
MTIEIKELIIEASVTGETTSQPLSGRQQHQQQQNERRLIEKIKQEVLDALREYREPL